MKRIIYTSILATLAAVAMAQTPLTTTSAVFVVPANADGTVNYTETDGVPDYPDKIAMTKADNGDFTLSNVAIEHGFYFASKIDDSGSLYSLAGWAVPSVQVGPNPLNIIRREENNPIKVDPGTYDLTFMPRDIYGTTLNNFTIRTSTGSDTVYPEHIYLIFNNDSGTTDVMTMYGANGLYGYNLTTSSGSFYISYEKRSNYPTYVYGPKYATDTNLTTNLRVDLSRNDNTTLPFTFTKKATSDGSITVSIVPGDEYVVLNDIILTGIEDVEIIPSDVSTHYYTITGVPVAHPVQGAVYIQVNARGQEGGVLT